MTVPPTKSGSAERLASILGDLVAHPGATMNEAVAHEAFSTIMSGGASEAQIGALLAIIAQRGPTVAELTGAARVMREHVTPVPVAPDQREHLIDTCGTGGAWKAFNISTAAAFVAAGAGAIVAKHGNRSRTGRGSAEVLEALGVNVNCSPEVQSRCLDEAGVCFSFAIHHHPATRHAMPARRALGFPTIFNLLGPLTNPAGAGRQLMGVFTREFARLNAQTLAALGCKRALVVHSDDGMDEISTMAPTTVYDVDDGRVTEWRIDPRDYGFAAPERRERLAPPSGGIAGSAKLIRDILAGRTGPARDIVVLNAAAAILAAGLAGSISEGLTSAAASIDSGAASEALRRLAAVSNR